MVDTMQKKTTKKIYTRATQEIMMNKKKGTFEH